MALVTVELHGAIAEMDDSLLDRTDGSFEDDHEKTTWVEYRLKGQPDSPAIHRSVHVTLKRNVTATSAVQGF